MSNWMENQRKKITKKIMVPALAAALAVAAGAYQFAKPSTAAAAAPATHVLRSPAISSWLPSCLRGCFKKPRAPRVLWYNRSRNSGRG